ncbi:MAG: glycosyltransferase, partial [Deltaproteobacteria bacterium]|nr:glycosyltransferase [Deltaproteobacteria bacterium]
PVVEVRRDQRGAVGVAGHRFRQQGGDLFLGHVAQQASDARAALDPAVHGARFQVEHDRDVFVTLAQIDLINGDVLEAFEFGPGEAFAEPPFLNVVGRVPRDTQVPRNVLRRHVLQQFHHIPFKVFGVLPFGLGEPQLHPPLRAAAGLDHGRDLVWIGNWGDGERSRELQHFLLQPIAALRLSARVYGVRYTNEARARLDQAGVEYCGWLPNHRVPEVFARFRVTVHVPRRFYAEQLPGIPTIRVFEALACGIPLISSPWQDCEGLFRAGEDFLVARDAAEMQRLLRSVLHDRELAQQLAERGRETILARHTCAHRVDELLAIWAELRDSQVAEEAAPPHQRAQLHVQELHERAANDGTWTGGAA